MLILNIKYFSAIVDGFVAFFNVYKLGMAQFNTQ